MIRVKSMVKSDPTLAIAANRMSFDDSPSTYGLIRNSPQLRLMVKEFL